MNSKKKKERIRKAVISYVAVIALLTCLPFSGVSVYGETVPDYNVGKAVEYAENHYSDQSTTTTDKPDCTQFVRECFEAGGVPKDENRTNENGPYGYTVDAYVDYLVNNGYATIEPLKTEKQEWSTPQWYVRASDNQGVFSTGDGVLYHCNSCEQNFHMSINTGINDDGFVLYHAQNAAVGGQPLCLIDCSKCGATRENVELSALHITSSGNGYSTKYNNISVSNVQAKRTDVNKVSITWDAAAGAAGYKVFVKNGLNSAYNFISDSKSTTLVYTEPTAGADYYFAVRPYFTENSRTYVGKMSDFAYNNEYLMAPTGVKASYDRETGKATITWDRVQGADRYEVYRSTSENGTYEMVYTNTGTRFITSNITAGVTYYFKIKAINDDNAAGNSPLSAAASVTVTKSGIDRYAGDNRFETAFAVANALKTNQGVEKFDYAIVASGDDYADALAGSYLAKVKKAPILVVNSNSEKGVRDYINNNVNRNGTVYILGGEGAVSKRFANSLSGYKVKRLGGNNRYETNLSILRESGINEDDILICSATSFADSLSASAVGKPIMLVNKTLYPEQKEFVSGQGSDNFYLIGGEGAVSNTVNSELKRYGSVERLAGSDRYATSKAVADKFFPDGSETIVIASGDTFPDGLTGGPLAMSLSSPLFLVNDRNFASAAEYTREYNLNAVTVVGGMGAVSSDAAEHVASGR